MFSTASRDSLLLGFVGALSPAAAAQFCVKRARIAMKTSFSKLLGWLTVLLGVVIGLLSPMIVDQIGGSEKLVGADGTHYVVDPPGMWQWVCLVVATGILVCLLGGWLISKSNRRKHENSKAPTA